MKKVNYIIKNMIIEVAKHGRYKDLDVLVNDGDEKVRMEVLKFKRYKDLIKLSNDKNNYIKKIAKDILKNNLK